MANYFDKTVSFLNDPKLVAGIQNYFGLEILKVIDESTVTDLVAFEDHLFINNDYKTTSECLETGTQLNSNSENFENQNYNVRDESNQKIESSDQKLLRLRRHRSSEYGTANSSTQKSQAYVRSVRMLDEQKCFYQVHNRLFYWFFLFVTHMGSEVFYILFLPIMMW